jgi:outer membrane lipoprotein-sorting protein
VARVWGWRQRAAGRWSLVVGLVAVLAALPAVIRGLPAEDSRASAAELRAAALASSGVGYSGYAQSAGRLALPVSARLTSVADLFSDRTTMRVWWRGPEENRVDVLTAGGETGVHRDRDGTWTWNYEADEATRGNVAPLALPAPPDLLPTTLGRRLLSEAADEELSRLGAQRIAGRDALGLRLVPSAPAASVARVDVWVDSATGLPLRVQVFGQDARTAALDTRFLDLDPRTPPASVVAFTPPADADVSTDRGSDLLDEAGRRLTRVNLPETLAGMPRRSLAGAPAAVGLYGRGITLLAVVPVPERLAGDLRRAASASPQAVADPLGIRLAAGPLGIMVVGAPDGPSYVLTGTVTLAALADAARRLPDLGSAG